MEQHLLHDLDLIADYSDGLLEDATEAAALVRECPDCLKEYELQQAVKGLLTGLPVIRMTAEERARLDATIGGLSGAKVITMTDRRYVQRWMRVASVAAATFVLVGLGSVFLGTMGGSGGGAAATTTAAATAQGAPPAEDSTTFEATTTVASMTGQTERVFRVFSGGDADAVRDEIETMIEEPLSEMYEADARDKVACHEEESDLPVLDVARSNLDGRPVVIAIVEGENGKEALIYDEATCELVDLPPE